GPTEPSHEAEAAAADEAVAEAVTEPVDPALTEWLAALNLPAAPAETPATAVAQSGERAGLAFTSQPAKGDARTPGDATQVVSPRGDATQELTERLQVARDNRGKPEPAAADAQTEASTWQAAVERVSVLAEAPARQDTPALGALGAAAQTPGVARSADAAAPVAVSMPTPATAPEFAQSLGVQVSVLVRDGVQQAELHLNPAEMGPISVQIALDGTQAQVNFGADSAATRQIIETGLPELAAALRDAGFTLSGGGVHSQARGRGDGDEASGGPPSGRNRASAEAEVTTQRISARVSAGGVDLYA
ncbi:MAG: flagellar hook-length control protein FliK, partial [Rhizobacter sp.]|nr:flagellar hook-length control protein FliK [Rhizobacter sp.]